MLRLTENIQGKNHLNIRYQRMEHLFHSFKIVFHTFLSGTVAPVSECLGRVMNIVEKWDLL